MSDHAARYPERARTERLLLRRTTGADLGAVTEVLSDPAAHAHNPARPRTPGEVADLLASWEVHWRDDGIGYWAVLSREGGELLGVGGLRAHDLGGERVLNLSYSFRPRHWGRGYATEMAGAALGHAAVSHPAWPPVIVTAAENTPAQRVAEKLGFAHAGEVAQDPEEGELRVYRRP
ncbi:MULTISPECIES: GNAT family N-acetyltransferase [Actinosynnema]|uniref:GNAT family N-acetyltransferase n=1 Tax=Actinosynnema TaxID=40566 RepID=UPI0020A25332|nr:GNAT family N-acetyltransferase [Actinosynnema pretiosum]MCP2099339.1 Protein N-acetyltransferase, RimJ/RimL family [Actinosynnema pretiosum]